MKPYIPDNRSSLRGMAIVALTAILGGLAIGGLLFLVSRFIYLIILFPVIAGALGGAILERAIKAGKMRIPIFAIICGLLMGIICYTSYNYYDYLKSRQDARVEIVDELSNPAYDIDPQDNKEEIADEIIDDGLMRKTGKPGFLGFLIINLQRGMTLKSTRSTSGGFTLTPLMTLIVWIAEMMIIGIAAAVFAKKQTEQPFCQTHNRWYNPTSHLGGFSLDGSNTTAIHQIRNGVFEQVGQLLVDNAPIPSTEIYAAKCPDCADSYDSLPWIEVSNTYLYRGKVQRKNVMQGLISQAQFLTLSRGKQA